MPDTVWDITHPGAPAHYGATGPGVDRSVKPDLHHTGGRALYTRPITTPGDETVTIEPAHTAIAGPGLQVAAPGRAGATNNTVFTVGTSNATALVTREASRLFDILEAGAPDTQDAALPDPQYHPLLVRALLAHASNWGDWEPRLRRELGLNNQQARRHLTALLGYGRLDTNRLGTAATNRAVLVGGGLIARNQRHTYDLPLPPSLRARAEWHRFTITLAYMVPTVGQLTRYRGAKVYFATPDTNLAGETERTPSTTQSGGAVSSTRSSKGLERWSSATATRSPSTSNVWTMPNGSVQARPSGTRSWSPLKRPRKRPRPSTMRFARSSDSRFASVPAGVCKVDPEDGPRFRRQECSVSVRRVVPAGSCQPQRIRGSSCRLTESVVHRGEIDGSPLVGDEKAALKFVCSSLVINAGADLADVALLTEGQELASRACSDTTPEQPLHFQCMYNVANAIVTACDLGLPTQATSEGRASDLAENRRANRVELRRAR